MADDGNVQSEKKGFFRLESLDKTRLVTINGIGATLYGKREVNQEDGSYIATKWFVLFFIPIIPLASYRVIKEKKRFLSFDSSESYQMWQVPLNKKQVRNTYLALLSVLVVFIIVLFISFFVIPYTIDSV